MPKPGKHINHKGRNRRFTNPEELEEERRREEEARKWKQQRGEISSEDEEASGDQDSENDSDDEDGSSDDDTQKKAKGVSNLIEIENPNRVQKKHKKLAALNAESGAVVVETPPEKPQLSRREREEIEKQRAQAHYQKLHAEGKTEQARADLARLAIIKQQREEAQKRREVEKKVREEAVKAKTAQTQKALGKK